MLFNRINHLFDQMNDTFANETLIDTWHAYLNASTGDGVLSPLDPILNATLNSSDVLQMAPATAINMTTMLANANHTNVIQFEPEPLFILILVTICYSLIFIAGILGNVITCTVISRNKTMHTATNYYLFNLAISDLILLLSGESNQTESACAFLQANQSLV